TGVADPTLSVAVAVPPAAPAGTKLSSVIVPGFDGVIPVIISLVTTPLLSVALTLTVPAVPASRLSCDGQLGTRGGLLTITVTAQAAVCAAGESLFDH